MSNVDAAELVRLVEIAKRAIEADEMERLAKIEQADLNTAYQDFKDERCLAHVDGGTAEWDRMMAATKAEYLSAEEAKRKAYNAKRRLKTAIDRHHRAA